MSYNRSTTIVEPKVSLKPLWFMILVFVAGYIVFYKPVTSRVARVFARESPAVAADLPVQFMAVEESLPTATSEPPIHIAWLPPTLDPFLGILADACNRWGVDPRLCAIVALVESGGNPYAVSESGAYGLMQIMPATGLLVAESLGTPVNINDIDSNVNAGAFLLGDELGYFGFSQSEDQTWLRSVVRTAAAYNGGRKYADELIDYETLNVGGNCALYYPEVYDQQMHRYACWVGGLWDDIELEQSDTLDYWLASGGQRLIDEAVAAQQ